MIEIDTHNFFVVFTVLGLLIAGLLAVRESIGRSSREQRRAGDNLCQCSHCRRVFVIRHGGIGSCPECGSLGRISRASKKV